MITAEYALGMLELCVPKAALPQATVIPVTTSAEHAGVASRILPRDEVRAALKPGSIPNGSTKTVRAK
jgi:hypothetical protein